MRGKRLWWCVGILAGLYIINDPIAASTLLKGILTWLSHAGSQLSIFVSHAQK